MPGAGSGCYDTGRVKICLIPLDERPATLRYPVLLGAIAGIEVVTPPPELLGYRRKPMEVRGLAAWLLEQAKRCQAAIVSCEALAHGGLVPSRISSESAAVVVGRLDVLRFAKARNPSLRILGSSVISRIANDNHAAEEPDYWSEYGRLLFAYSVVCDRDARGLAAPGELRRATEAIPEAVRRDFHGRRLRNHGVNLAALGLAAEGVFDFLAITSDDTHPFGLPAREKRWISEQVAALDRAGSVLLYPGADEAACTLLARVVQGAIPDPVRFAVVQAVPGDAGTIPPFEDVPIGDSVLRQLRAAGAAVVRRPAAGEMLLAVNTPVPGRGVFDPAQAAVDAARRGRAVRRMVARLQREQARGVPCAVADVAYANGADPVLVDALFRGADLGALRGYAGWNTAGNTLGTVIAQAICAHRATTAARERALQAFTFHRLVEDWGYQQCVRGPLREALRARTGHPEPAARGVAGAERWTEARLAPLADGIPGLGARFRIRPGSVRLPWRRTFEVDFNVEDRR